MLLGQPEEAEHSHLQTTAKKQSFEANIWLPLHSLSISSFVISRFARPLSAQRVFWEARLATSSCAFLC